MFQPNIEAEHLPVRFKRLGGADDFARHYQAFKAAPAITHAKEAHIVEHGCKLLFATWLKLDREQAACAGKVALP